MGKNFADIIEVKVGGQKAISYEVVNDTLIRAIPGKGTGSYVDVTSKSSAAFINGYIYNGLITRKVEPMGGREGDVIRLSGQLYNTVTQVIVAGTPVQQFQALNDSVILATLNAGGKGAVEVISTTGAYSYPGFNVMSVSQTSSRIGMPGDTVIFKGKNLRFVNGATFGSSLSFTATVLGDTLVKMIVPAIPQVNDRKLKLFSPYDTLQVMATWNFALPATIIDFWPKVARYTDTVTIRGTHLASTSSVRTGPYSFGNIIFKNDTLVKVIVSSSAQSEVIRVITTDNGDASSIALFTFLATPSIGSISPIPAGPGDTLDIKGRNLKNIQRAQFGYNSNSPLGTLIYASDSLLRIPIRVGYQSPLLLYSGTYQIYQLPPLYQYLARPWIDSVKPMMAAEGMPVEIFGSHFSGVTEISFGGVPATSFSGKTINSRPVFDAYPGNGSPGLVEITNNFGKGKFSGFVYTYKPLVQWFYPKEVGVHDTIRIVGGNFDRVTEVKLGSLPVKYFQASDKNHLKIVVGSGREQGIYDLQLIGEDTVVLVGKITYYPPEVPVISFDTIAHPNKMIKIAGKHFIRKEDKNYVEVWFGDILQSKIHPQGDSVLFVKIPANATNFDIKVITRYGEGFFSGIKLKWPCVIDSVYPGFAEPGEIITVYGKNLAGVVDGPRLFLADRLLDAESVTDNKITFKMPVGSTGGDLRLSVNGYTDEFSDAVHGKFTAINTTISKNRFSIQSLPYISYSRPAQEAFHDLDSDGRPDWIRVQDVQADFYHIKTNIIIRRNISTADSVIFAEDAILDSVLEGNSWGANFSIGDLDNDGSPDLFFWNLRLFNNPTYGYKITNIRFEQGKWKTKQSKIRFRRPWLAAAIGDVNHDGLNDFLVGSWTVSDNGRFDPTIYEWYEGNHPENSNALDRIYSTFIRDIDSYDFDQGYGLNIKMLPIRHRNAPDFELSSSRYTQQTLPFSNSTSITNSNHGFAGTVLPTSIAFSDLNNDGARDYVGFDYNYGLYGKTFWNNKSLGNNPLFDIATDFNIGSLVVSDVNVADLNGDGKKDIIVNSKGNYEMAHPDSIHFLERTGDVNNIEFVKRSFLFTDFDYDDKSLTLMDLNGDGKSDLVFRVYNLPGIKYKILLNKIGSLDDVYVCDGQDAPVLIAGKTGSSYQWQSSTGSSYENMVDGPGVEGVLTNSIQLSDLTLAQNNLKIRCVVDGVPAQGYVIKIINRWIGVLGENADWHNPANWSCGIVPNETTNVLIDGAEVNINSDAACSTLQLINNAKVNVKPNTRLNIVK
jgi:hypothetical protein